MQERTAWAAKFAGKGESDEIIAFKQKNAFLVNQNQLRQVISSFEQHLHPIQMNIVIQMMTKEKKRVKHEQVLLESRDVSIHRWKKSLNQKLFRKILHTPEEGRWPTTQSQSGLIDSILKAEDADSGGEMKSIPDLIPEESKDENCGGQRCVSSESYFLPQWHLQTPKWRCGPDRSRQWCFRTTQSGSSTAANSVVVKAKSNSSRSNEANTGRSRVLGSWR